MKFTSLKNKLKTRFTFMLIPHTSGKPVQIHFSLSFLLLVLSAWTGVTIWGTYLSAQHMDYWRAEFSNQVLDLKVKYLVKQINSSRELLDEVKQIDGKLRDLLEYNNKYSIITDDKDAGITGGPSLEDESDMEKILSSQNPSINWDRIVQKVALMKGELENRISSYGDIDNYVSTQRKLFRATPYGWPAPGYLSSHFGSRTDPFSGRQEHHYGVDISGPHGTPVRSTADGVVKLSGWFSGYGNLVVIQHDFGFATRYAHNGRIMVKVGDEVKRGQAIALMGNTGKSTGPHCHYEVWQHKKRVNPYAYLNGEYPKLDSLSSTPSKKKSNNS